jgi:alpha-1,6-mannosyltransferase
LNDQAVDPHRLDGPCSPVRMGCTNSPGTSARAYLGLSRFDFLGIRTLLPIRDNRTALLVVGFGLVFRLTGLFAPAYQSEDVYRYIWDARVSSRGLNPFQFAPEASELESIRDDKIYPMINSKPYVTTYPPLTQVLFRLGVGAFGESITGMKVLFSSFEFVSVLILWKLLILMGQSLSPLYLIAWNPFFIFEFSHSGHSDSAMMFFTLLTAYLLFKSRNVWAMVSYAGAVLTKLHPALWVALWVRRSGWRAACIGLAAGSAVALTYFDFNTLSQYLNSLRLYFQLFEFNAGIHYLLRFIGRIFFDQSWDKLIGPYLASALVLAAILISWKFRLDSVRDVLHAGFWLMTADLCLATTVHPWYLSWAALALPLFPYAFMVYWTGACFLSYLAYSYHPVFEPAWVLLVEYIPMYGLMAWEIWRGAPLLDSGSEPMRKWLRQPGVSQKPVQESGQAL